MRWVVLAALALGACTGSDPDPTVATKPEAGVPTTPGADAGDAGVVITEAGPGSCAGRTFDTPRPVAVSGISEPANAIVRSLRPVGTSVYFTRSTSNITRIFRGTWTATGPSVTGATEVIGEDEGFAHSGPAVESQGSTFIVFAREQNEKRQLYVARAGVPGFAGVTEIKTLNVSDGDNADPWVAGGAKPTSIYWGHGKDAVSATRVYRARLTPAAGAVPTFDIAIQLGSPCPLLGEDNCGAPVVTPDETLLLYAAWPKNDFSPTVHEASMTSTADGVVTPTGADIEHKELGKHVPTWISADGCEVLLSLNGSADLAYARRLPQ